MKGDRKTKAVRYNELATTVNDLTSRGCTIENVGDPYWQHFKGGRREKMVVVIYIKTLTEGGD